jgi:hypothetical protein
MSGLSRFLAPIVLFALLSPGAQAVWQLEGSWGAQVDQLGNEPVTFGSSLRLRTGYLFFGNASFKPEIVLLADFPGSYPWIVELFPAGGFTVGEDVFFRMAAGPVWSLVAGFGFGAEVGLGVRLTNDFYFVLPFSYKTGGLGGMRYAPYVGWRF